jgi:mRNA-degrading endonuclease RelE of RelBE toxin-antitoxin system
VKRVLFRPSAAKELERLQTRDRELVEAAIERFARAGEGDVKMLKGAERHMRLRAGDWRVRFVYEHPNAIRILHIHNRREAYR